MERKRKLFSGKGMEGKDDKGTVWVLSKLLPKNYQKKINIIFKVIQNNSLEGQAKAFFRCVPGTQ